MRTVCTITESITIPSSTNTKSELAADRNRHPAGDAVQTCGSALEAHRECTLLSCKEEVGEKWAEMVHAFLVRKYKRTHMVVTSCLHIPGSPCPLLW